MRRRSRIPFLEVLTKFIVRNLLDTDYVYADNPQEFEEKIFEILKNRKKEDSELMREVERMLEENRQEIYYRGLSSRQVRQILKKKLAEERKLPAGPFFSRENAQYVAGKIINLLKTDDSLDYKVELSVVRRTVIRAFDELIKLREEIDESVRRKIMSHSKPIYEGTAEWDALYSKYYLEELIERGLVEPKEES